MTNIDKLMLIVFDSDSSGKKPTQSEIQTGQHQDLKGGKFSNKNTLEVNK